jgi:site-specific recombinase XerD
MKMSKKEMELYMMEHRDTYSLQHRVRWIEGYLEYFRIEDIKRRNEVKEYKREIKQINKILKERGNLNE